MRPVIIHAIYHSRKKPVLRTCDQTKMIKMTKELNKTKCFRKMLPIARYCYSIEHYPSRTLSQTPVSFSSYNAKTHKQQKHTNNKNTHTKVRVICLASEFCH